MIDYILAGIILIQLAIAILSDVRHARQIDQLTSKIMAPTLADYEETRPVGKPIQSLRRSTPNALPRTNLVPIDEAPMEDVLRSMAESAGQLDDYMRSEP